MLAYVLNVTTILLSLPSYRVLLASHSFPSTESNPMSSQDSHVTLNMLLQLVREHTTLSEDQLNGIAITCGDFEVHMNSLIKFIVVWYV